MHVRKGDLVEVVAGDDKSRKSTGRKIARVLRVIPSENKVVVEGVNKAYKHVRPSQRNPRGGRLSREMPISASNVLLYNPELGRGVRTGVRINAGGEKVRYCKKTGKDLGVLRQAKSEQG
jgi:large subunit ribosomal protein L24